MSTIILNMKDIPESKIMPKAPDESKFATIIEVDTTAPDGSVYKHKNGKNIKKKIRIVTDEAKEKDVMDTYKYKKELAIKEIEKYKKEKCIFLLKEQIHPEVWLQLKGKPDFEKKFTDGDLLGVIELLREICGVSGDMELLYAPMECTQMIFVISQFKQRDLSLDNYEKRLRSKVKTLTGSNGPHPFGTSFLREVLQSKGKGMNDYSQMTDALKTEYDKKALELLMACLFVLGCNTKEPMEMYWKISDKYAHGAKDAYPVTLHKAITLYRKIYLPPKKTKHQPNNNNRNKEKEEKNEDTEKENKDETRPDEKDPEEEGAIGAHMEIEKPAEKPLRRDDIDKIFVADLIEEYKSEGFSIDNDNDYGSECGYPSEDEAMYAVFLISNENKTADNLFITFKQGKFGSEHFCDGDL